MSGALGVGDRQPRDDHADDRRQQQHPPLDIGPGKQPEPVDRRAHDRRRDPDDQGPAEFRDVGPGKMGQARDRQGKGAEPGQRVKADEDEGTHAGGEQAGQQDDPRHRTQARGLHQQERPRDGRAEQRADGGEAARRGHHGGGLGGQVALGQPDREDGQAAAERDQRCLRTQHDAEAQGGQGRQHYPGKLGRRGRAAAGLEPVSGRVAALPRQEPDDRCDQQAGHREDGKRPPRWRAVKAQPVGQVGEDLGLQVGDEGQKTVGRGGDWRAEHRGEDQQSQVTLAPQQGLRVLGHRHCATRTASR